jgi:uncharacterized protein YndB with AHSA1/START domain
MEMQIEKTTTSVELRRTFQAPVDRLYNAWIDPQMMNGWFHPQAEMISVCTVDLRVGGRYEIQMHSERGDSYIVSGTYREIVPKERLVFTWQWQGEEYLPESLVTLTFRAVSAVESELTLLHSQFANEEEMGNHAEGWVGTLDQLAATLLLA